MTELAGGTNYAAEDEINLRELIATLWDGKWIIAAVTVLFTAASVVYALLAQPVYRSEALVQIRGESKQGAGIGALATQLGGIADLAGISLGGGGDRAVSMATLTSRTVLESFIRETNLMPKLFIKAWDAENRKWKSDDPGRVPTVLQGYNLFRVGVLRVSEDKKTRLVTIAVEWRDPREAQQWVTELIARTNLYLKEEAIREGERNLSYLESQVQQTSLVELQRALYNLMESEQKKLMLAKGSDEFAFRTIDPAFVPEKPIWPKRRQVVAVAFLSGGFLGGVAALAWAAHRKRRAAG